LGGNSLCIWFTGLSGAGKTTLAYELDFLLHKEKIPTTVLDGDLIRKGLCKDLGMSVQDRTENIRRTGEVCKLFVESGTTVITSFISPIAKDRQYVRSLFAENEFLEIYVDTPLEICEKRDPKGLYLSARKGEIKNFTGIDSPYEPPSTPEFTLREIRDLNLLVQRIVQFRNT
jgi:adenylylsulfate kinase